MTNFEFVCFPKESVNVRLKLNPKHSTLLSISLKMNIQLIVVNGTKGA